MDIVFANIIIFWTSFSINIKIALYRVRMFFVCSKKVFSQIECLICRENLIHVKMSGIYLPRIQGEIDGRKVGLQNAATYQAYILQNDPRDSKPQYQSKMKSGYYIGFEEGYAKGQEIRCFLEEDQLCFLSFEEKIICFSRLLQKQESCRTELATEFLKNITFWDRIDLPKEIYENAKLLLVSNKIQQVIQLLFEESKVRYYLKACTELDAFGVKLKKLRKAKMDDNQINNSNELRRLNQEISEWISSQK